MVDILIPTRNRPELLKYALDSVYHQLDAIKRHGVKIYVSDNSENALSEQTRALLDDYPGVRYLRPGEELSMTDHWDWAIGKIQEQGSSEYLMVLTDRFGLLKNGLNKICEKLSACECDLLSFSFDTIDDSEEGNIKVIHRKWSEAFTWRSKAEILNECQHCRFGADLPKLLNCVVRSSILGKHKSKTGRFLSSVSPDFYFCFSYISENEGYMFYDTGILFQHGLNRSNGLNFAKKRKGADALDFEKFLPRSRSWNAPIGDLDTLVNAVVHEYNVVSENLVKDGRKAFPSVHIQKYGDALLEEIENKFLEDHEGIKSRLRSLGWEEISQKKFFKRLPSRKQIALRVLSTEWGLRTLELLSPLPVINNKRRRFKYKDEALQWLNSRY